LFKPFELDDDFFQNSEHIKASALPLSKQQEGTTEIKAEPSPAINVEGCQSDK
jgi:hypothetical protein